MPNNYKYCNDCPYKNQQHLPNKSAINSPLSLEIGNNADTLLVFQAPGMDEWHGNTISKQRTPIDSINPRSTAARIRASMQRKGVIRANYDITEAVQCFPGRKIPGRDKKPCKKSQTLCAQYLEQDLRKKQYQKIIAFGCIAYKITFDVVNKINSTPGPIRQPHPQKATHPSAWISQETLDKSY